MDMVDIGEFSRHQALWTVGRCGCGALGANRVCRFVVAGENGVRACPKSGQEILSDCVELTSLLFFLLLFVVCSQWFKVFIVVICTTFCHDVA